jgi:hypothetical protein
MIQYLTEEHELRVARDLWRRRAAMQGMLCMSCLEIPALEHRHAFYDTGLCETCAEPDGAAQSA